MNLQEFLESCDKISFQESSGGNKALLLSMEYLKLEQVRPGGIGLSHGCLVTKARRSQDGCLLLLVLQGKLKASLKSETLSQNRK